MIGKTPQQAARFIINYGRYLPPKIGILLGSGFSRLIEELQPDLSIPYAKIPGFPECSVAGHLGVLHLGRLGGVPVACLQGRAHYYEGKSGAEIRIPIRTLKLLGCKVLVLTNAAASLREELTPGNLVMISDHINFQFQNPLVGPNDEELGPRFPSLQDAYDKELISLALTCAHELDIKLATGVYLATLGPCYETPAEIRAFRMLGADLVGMSTVPEVIIARHLNMKVLAVSAISNMACGMTNEPLTHEAVLKTVKIAENGLSKLLIKIITSLNRSLPHIFGG